MKTRFSILSFLLLVVFVGQVSAQPKISRAEAQSDMDTLNYFIRNVHPDMFFVRPQADFESDFIKIYNNLPDSITVTDFYRQVAPLVASLGDGHTSCWIDPKEIPDMKVLPLKVVVLPESKILQVVHDLSGTSTIPDWSTVDKIDGEFIRPMVEEMIGCISGEREAFRLQCLDYRFPVMLYAFKPADQYTVDYHLGKEFLTTLECIPYSEYQKRLDAVEPEETENYAFKVLPGKIGLITFNAFEDADRFKKFLDSTFTIVKDRALTDLIIDIRKNGGGNSKLGDELFQYISPVPFEQYGTVHVNYNETTLGRPLKANEKPGINIILEEKSPPALRNNPLRFKGKLYLLTSASTFSAASDFAWTFQYFNMGTVIGEETGGLIVSYGDTIARKLNYSRLGIGSSFKKFYGYGATDKNLHGVKPDVVIPADEALDATLATIRSSR